MLAKVLILLCLIQFLNADPSCQNEAGLPVDWFVIYKVPDIDGKKGSKYDGKEYAYIDSDLLKRGKTWSLSSIKIDSLDSVLGKSLSILYNDNQISYILYNDQQPSGKQAISNGHAKGVVAFGDRQGFWLLHSAPKFPPEPNVTGKYSYPKTAEEYGQIFICVNFNVNDAEEIGQQLIYVKPAVYDSRLRPEFKKIAPVFENLSAKPKAPFYRNVSLTSLGGQEFFLFSKARKFNMDLYSNLLAPALMTSLQTETWRKGSGDKLDPNCTTANTVTNIEGVKLNLQDLDSISFPNVKDHSKWAVSGQAEKPWVCLADINRMESQFKRGGGAMCLKLPAIWKIFNSAVVAVDPCPVKNKASRRSVLRF